MSEVPKNENAATSNARSLVGRGAPEDAGHQTDWNESRTSAVRGTHQARFAIRDRPSGDSWRSLPGRYSLSLRSSGGLCGRLFLAWMPRSPNVAEKQPRVVEGKACGKPATRPTY